MALTVIYSFKNIFPVIPVIQLAYLTFWFIVSFHEMLNMTGKSNLKYYSNCV